MPDQVYSEANPAAHGGPRRPEPFVELGLMSKQPPSDHAFWYVKRWETERVDEFDPRTGIPLSAPTSGVKGSQKVAKPKLGGFGISPLYDAYHNGNDQVGYPKVLGQQLIILGQIMLLPRTPAAGHRRPHEGPRAALAPRPLGVPALLGRSEARRCVFRCGAAGVALWGAGCVLACARVRATARRSGGAGPHVAAGTRRLWEKSNSFYVVAEVADNDTEVPHPGFPLPAVGT